jgi:phosphoglycolate phosphatase
MLAELAARGFVLGIATGKSRRGLDRVLAQHGIAHHFGVSRCADEGHPKPHPDMLLSLMEQADVGPEATLMIGDTTHDLQLARNAGTARWRSPTARTRRMASPACRRLPPYTR